MRLRAGIWPRDGQFLRNLLGGGRIKKASDPVLVTMGSQAVLSSIFKGLAWPGNGILGLSSGLRIPEGPKDASLDNQRFCCCACHGNMLIGPCLWEEKKLDKNVHAERCWGNREGYKAGGEIRYCSSYCLVSTPSIWPTKFRFSQTVEERTEFRPFSIYLLVGTWPGFVLFLLLPLRSRSVAMDSEHVADTWCCLMEDYHPITRWFLENALCCKASKANRPECECFIRKEMFRWGKPSCDTTPVASMGESHKSHLIVYILCRFVFSHSSLSCTCSSSLRQWAKWK